MARRRITDPEELLPIWFSLRMVQLRGSFGLLLTTGDVLRITTITALHESPHGVVLLDVLLDAAGVPDGVDQAWRSKHYLGAPIPGATMATVNLSHVVAAVEFVVAEIAEPPNEKALPRRGELDEPAPEAERSMVETAPATTPTG